MMGKSNLTSALETQSSSTYQSATSKTIRPADIILPERDERRKRRIHDTSSWTPGKFSTSYPSPDLTLRTSIPRTNVYHSLPLIITSLISYMQV